MVTDAGIPSRWTQLRPWPCGRGAGGKCRARPRAGRGGTGASWATVMSHRECRAAQLELAAQAALRVRRAAAQGRRPGPGRAVTGGGRRVRGSRGCFNFESVACTEVTRPSLRDRVPSPPGRPRRGGARPGGPPWQACAGRGTDRHSGRLSRSRPGTRTPGPAA